MIGILFIVIGIVTVFYAIRFLRDPKFAKNYIQTSPKAFIWRKLLGEEKAIQLTKRLFVPLGIVVGTCLILGGIHTFFG